MEGQPRRLAVTEQNRAPLYHQLFMILQGKIHDGEFSEGSMLPGEHRLAATYKVSRITASRALNELAKSGLVIREKGRGTVVRSSIAGKVSRGPAEFDRTNRDGQGKPHLLSFEYIAAPSDIAAALQIPVGTEVQRAVRMWRVGGRPYNHLTTHIAGQIGRRWTKREMGERPLNGLLHKNGFLVDRIEEFVTATLADPQLAANLEVSVGGPLLKIVRTSFDMDGHPLEHLIAFYAPDRYEYQATLGRHDIDRNHIG